MCRVSEQWVRCLTDTSANTATYLPVFPRNVPLLFPLMEVKRPFSLGIAFLFIGVAKKNVLMIYLQNKRSRSSLKSNLALNLQKHWYVAIHQRFFFKYWRRALCVLFINQIRKMDLEARSLPPGVKSSLLVKLREFKSDLNNFKTEAKRITSGNLNAAARDELLEAGLADTKTVCQRRLTHCLICS